MRVSDFDTGDASREMMEVITKLVDRINVVEKQLRIQLAWVNHWNDDRRAGLLPMEQSLNDAREAIEKVLK